MRKFLSLVIGFITIIQFTYAQGEITPNYDLAERFSAKKVSRMVKSTSIRPNWFKNSDKFWYQWETTNGLNYYIVDPVAKTQNEVFNLEKLAMELSLITHDPFDAQHLPLKNLDLKEDHIFCFEIQSNLEVEKKLTDKEKADTLKDGKKKRPEMEKKLFRFEYDYNTKKLTDVSDSKEKVDYPRWASLSPDTSIVVYAKNYNLFYTDMDNLRKIIKDKKDSTIVEHQLTTDGTKDIAYGGNDYTGSEDIDTTKRYNPRILWSEDSKHFSLCKYDMSMVKELWVINSVTSPRPKLETYKYQMPGEPGPKTFMMVFNIDDKSSKYINISAFKDQSIDLLYKSYTVEDIYKDYFPAPIWKGDNENFYFARKSRDLHRIDICKANINTGEVKVVVEESMNTYQEIREPYLTKDGKELIQWSERNGWAHLYLYSTDGSLKNQITNGAYHVFDIVRVDEKQRVVYFTANGYDKKENPYYQHVYRVNFDGSNLIALNPGDFFSDVEFSEDSKYFIDNISRVDLVPYVVLRDNTGRKVLDLQEADFSQLFMAGYKFPETVKVKAADGITDIYGVMYKPFDFDSTKVYPIIEYVYPGPQVEATNYVWRKGMNRVDRLSQLGFIVVTMGNRGGHPDRSKWYHNYGYGNMRDYPLEDHKTAVQQLAARYKFINPNKVGIHGHSGGGFMSTAAILSYPDFYKVAVSCAGNHDNNIYNRWWSETHHGVKEVITDKGDTTFNYSIKYNQELVKNLKGHLLLVHGDVDNNVHPANTTRVVDALIRANKRFDMLFLPGQRHGFGDMDEYFFWKMADYFSKHLLGESQESIDIPQMNNN